MIVLDEADRLFEETLLPDMKNILSNIDEIKQIVLATATIDENFEAKTLKNLLNIEVNFLKHSTYEGVKTVSSNRLTQSYILSP